MKRVILLAVFAAWISIPALAQGTAPKGFKSGAIQLADGSLLNGFVKDNLRSSAGIVFIAENTTAKKTYTGNDLAGLQIEANHYTCVRGDFFLTLCEGELCFLQKASDASAVPSYNGNETVFASGTEGSIGDYFLYNGKTRLLTLVNRKNLATVAATCFSGHAAALDKARSAQNDLSQLREAVELFNRDAE